MTVLVRYRGRGLAPAPAGCEEEARRVVGVLARWGVVFPEDPRADRETSWEEAFRLAAALEVFADEDVHLWGLAAGPAPQGLPDRFDIEWGPEPETLVARGDHSADRRVTFPYWEWDAFRSAARREFIRCGIGVKPPHVDLSDVWDELASTDGRVFLKSTGTKVYASPLTRGPYGETECSGDEDYDEAAGWTRVRLSGLPDVFIAQPFVPMTDEHRFFVVGGRVVTGAPKTLTDTPFDVVTADGAFRRTPHMPALRAFAERTAAELFEDRPGLGFYVLDVARDGAGDPIAVELNEPGAAGLFATDARIIARALLA